MLKIYKKYLLLLVIVSFSVCSLTAQNILSSQVRITDNTPKTYTIVKKGLGKTSTSPVDTVKYAQYKATVLNAINLVATTNSSNGFAQWFDAPQPITISGFDFYGWQRTGTNQVVTLTCKIFNANPTDSLPTGNALASVTVNVDSTFGGGFLTDLKKQAIFSLPVTVTGPYVLAIETQSSITVGIVTNSWTATPPNGRSEWLSSIHFGNNVNYTRSHNGITVNSVPFNADFLMHPYVTYSLTADFAPSSVCNQGGNLMQFTNISSPVLFNKFYNTRAFYNITYISCMWDYGDTSGTWYALNGQKTYNHRAAYTVTLKDTIVGWTVGCVDSKSSNISASPAPVNSSSNSPVCPGSLIKLFADTVQNASYYWTGPNGFTSTLQNPTISNAGAIHQGGYFVRAVMGSCTSAVTNTIIAIQSTPQASSNSPLCQGQTLSLTASTIANAVYSWTGPNGFSSSLQSPNKTNASLSDSGNYSVTITSAGCGTIGPFILHVSVNPIPATPTASNNGPLCVGNNLNLTSTGVNGTYSWTGPNGFVANTQNLSRSNVQASFAGVYSVIVSNNGCGSTPATTTVVINNNPATPVASNNGPLCQGQTISLTASLIANATYQWSGPNGFSSSVQNPTRANITLLDGGNYSVIATANGCSSPAATTNVAVSSSTPAPVATYNGPLCPGQTLSLFASNVPGATYSWTGPNSFTSSQQNPSITNITNANAGTYSVTAVTSGCGTSSAGNVTVTINSLPSSPSITQNGPLCDGDSLILTASDVSGGTYNWSGPNGFTSNLQNPVVKSMNASKAGMYSIFVDVSGCGSSNTNSTQVIVHRIPQIPVISGVNSICEGDTIKFSGISGSTGVNRLFSWTGPNNFTSFLKDIAIANAGAGNSGLYTLTVSDSGCTSSMATVTSSVKSRPAMPLASNNSPVCAGSDVQLNATATFGSLYKWIGPGGFLSNSQNPILFGTSGLTSGTYFVTASLNGCTSIAGQTTVYIYPLPQTPVASNDGPKCEGSTITLTSNPIPGVIYSWTGPIGFTSSSQNPVLSNAKTGMSGIYSLNVVDSHCVSLPDTTLVTINSVPAAPSVSNFPTGTNFCAGDSVQLFATFTSGATYEWQGPAGFGSFLQNPVIRNSTAANSGTYSVFLTKNNCPSLPASLTITINPLPLTSNIIGADSVFVGTTKDYQISGDSGSVFNWVSFGGVIQGAATGTQISVKWGTNPGNGFVRVRETGVKGCKGPLVQENVVISKNTGMTDADMSIRDFSIYPVPSNKRTTIAFTSLRKTSGEISVYNMLGEKVMREKIQISEGKQQTELKTDGLADGIYHVVMEGKDFVIRGKIEIIK